MLPAALLFSNRSAVVGELVTWTCLRHGTPRLAQATPTKFSWILARYIAFSISFASACDRKITAAEDSCQAQAAQARYSLRLTAQEEARLCSSRITS